MSAQFSRSSSASLDFPMPGSPTSSTSVPKPIRTGATEAARTARSRSRSTNGSLSSVRSSARALSRTSLPRTTARTGSFFPFTWNGSSSLASKNGASARERLGRDPNLVLARASHQAGGERRRVAEHGVRPPEARAHLTREDAPLAHPDVDREREAFVQDRPHGSEKPLLVVPERLRSARDQDDPSTVSIDIAFEERHSVRGGAGLDDPDEAVERRSCRLRPFGRDHLVRPPEPDERDGGTSVLAFQRPDFEQLRAQRRRDGHLERDPLHVREGLHRASDLGRVREEVAPFLAPRRSTSWSEKRCCLLAEQDLACLRRGFHLHRPSRCGPGDEKLAVRLPHEEELKASGVEAGVHLQLNRAGGRLRSSDRSQRPTHLECSTRCSRGVIVTLVEQQQGVAAKLEQATALGIGHGEQCGEGGVHHLCDFFRAGSAEAGKPLGHCGESRDVDEGERALDLAPQGLGMVAEPFERQPRDERDKLGRRRVLDRLIVGHVASFCVTRPLGQAFAGRVPELGRPGCVLHGTFTARSTQSPRKGGVRYVVVDE